MATRNNDPAKVAEQVILKRGAEIFAYIEAYEQKNAKLPELHHYCDTYQFCTNGCALWACGIGLGMPDCGIAWSKILDTYVAMTGKGEKKGGDAIW